jgi:hypothetical protein
MIECVLIVTAVPQLSGSLRVCEYSKRAVARGVRPGPSLLMHGKESLEYGLQYSILVVVCTLICYHNHAVHTLRPCWFTSSTYH